MAQYAFSNAFSSLPIRVSTPTSQSTQSPIIDTRIAQLKSISNPNSSKQIVVTQGIHVIRVRSQPCGHHSCSSSLNEQALKPSEVIPVSALACPSPLLIPIETTEACPPSPSNQKERLFVTAVKTHNHQRTDVITISDTSGNPKKHA